MSVDDYRSFGNCEVRPGNRGNEDVLVLINGVAVTAAEIYFAVSWMGGIQRRRFGDDDNASLSILGDLAEIDGMETPREIKRGAVSIQKKWDGVRLALSKRA